MALPLVSERYTGTLLIFPISKAIGHPVDELNFVACQLIAVFLGVVLRVVFPQTAKFATCRYLYCLFAGITLLWAMIGWQCLLVFAQVIVSYILMRVLPATKQQLPVFVFALGFMLALYVHRLMQPFNELCFDTTYPLMITTQKLTCLAFSISDWRYSRRGDKMDADRLKWAVRDIPSILEFMSFNLSYQGILAGPFCHFRTYKAFIEGNNRDKSKEDNEIPVDFLDGGMSVVAVVFKKFVFVIIWIMLAMYFRPHFPDDTNVDPEFIASYNMFVRLGYLYLSMFMHRTKYYVTWSLADIVYNASGMGYLGKDENGQHDWSGMSNINIWKIESATSLKVYLDNWNIKTTWWLRHVCYTRCPIQRTLMTFLLSALWHGLFVGYYVTFLSASLFVEAGRKIRHSIRPMFQKTLNLKLLYEVITFFGTQVILQYIVLSFVVLQVEPSIRFYNSFYWCFHVICALLFVVLPSKKSSHSHQQEPQTKYKTEDYHQKNMNNNGVIHDGMKDAEEVLTGEISLPRRREVMHVQKT